MITITCDQTGISENFDLADVEVREGKKPGEWQFLIKGIEKLQYFGPNAVSRELNMILSKEAKKEWDAKDTQLKEQALTDRMKAVKEMQQAQMPATTNTNTA
jgi:hypothetical protein